MKKAKAPTPTEETNADDITPENFRSVILALTAQAEAGDTSVIPRIREKIREDKELWCMFGDMREIYRKELLQSMTPDVLQRETTELWMDEEARVLAGKNPTPIEKLLALRITLDGLYLAHVELQTLTRQQAGCSIPVAEFDERRITAAHKRYFQGMKLLAQVRKLAITQGKNKPEHSVPHAVGIPLRVHPGHAINGSGPGVIPTHASNS